MARRVGCLMPEEVAGLALRWNPFSLALNNGDNVVNWYDTISNSLLYPSIVNGFKYTSNQLNGYPTISQFGFNNILTSDSDMSNAVSSDFTFFAVLKQNAVSVSTQYFRTQGNLGGFQVAVGASNTLGYIEWKTAGGALNSFSNSIFTVPINQYFIICINIKRNGNAYMRTFINNRTKVSSNVLPYQAPPDNKIWLGNISNEINIRSYGEIVIYNRALTEQEENAVYRGLQLKYKI